MDNGTTTDNTPVISFRGETHTLYEWSRVRDIHFSLMYHRWQSGCRIAKVLGLDIKPWKIHKPKDSRRTIRKKRVDTRWRVNPRWLAMWTFDNTSKPCVHWAELFGISSARLFHRVEKFGGGDVGFEQALVSFFQDGTISLLRLASALGLNYAAVYKRFTQMGRKPQLVVEALKPPNYRGQLLSYRGERVPIKKLAKWLDIPCRTLNARVKRYGSAPEAMKLLIYPGRLTQDIIGGSR